jgi:putative inorganic carbon (HCO3(-)) transporter
VRDIFVVLSVLATVPLSLRWPHVGILAWCWLSYMNPHRLTWGFAFNLPLAMIVAVTTLLAWISSKEPKRIPLNAVTWFLLALVFWMSFANLFAMVPDLAYLKWEQAIKILVMTFATLALCGTRERLHALIWVIVASLSFFGLKGGVFTILGGGENLVWGPPGSFITDNNALALALIMVLPLIRYLQLHTDQKLLRWGLYATFVISIFSIIGSSSRGAFLALAATAFFLILKSRHRLVLGLGVVAMLAVSAAFVPQHWIDRMKTIETYQEDGSAMGRLQAWGFAIKVALDRPIVGGGFRVSYNDDIYKKYVPDAVKSRNFHSVYFEVLGELGFPGLFIFLGLLIATWRCANSIIRLTRNHEELSWANDLARMIQISLVGFAVGGAFQNLAFYDLYYHIIAILFLTQQIVAKSIPSSALEQAQEDRPIATGTPAAQQRHVRIGPRHLRRLE